MTSAARPTNDAAADARDIRPVIKTGGSSNLGLYAFLGVLLVGGLVLFNALSASREGAQTPTVLQPADAPAQSQISSPQPLSVPDRFALAPPPPDPAVPVRSIPVARPEPRAGQPPIPQRQPMPFQPPLRLQPNPPVPAAQSAAPQVVFENRTPAASAPRASETASDRARVSADRLLNPSRTIPQGTVIPAVLETAMDSTNGGGVRALVQRDVTGFDGTRILIPRGSRLYGEYEANLQRGQNRAMVQWTRLIRPDGVTIALDSPSSDPLGRAGIKGKVDSKFLQRFGGAILQSVLDIGVGIAVNEASDGVIVALPGSTQNVQITEPESIQPTLKVKHGTSVSVFVARDLDFSSVDP